MNQITLPAADLKQALPGFNKVIQRKAALPALQSIRLTRNSAGLVTLAATDLDVFVSYNLEQLQSGQPFDILLPFEQLNKTYKGSGSDTSVIEESKHKAKLCYQVAGSPLEQSVDLLAVDEFPPTPQITEPSIKLPANFGETLRQAFTTSSNDSSRYVIQGAYLDVADSKCHHLVSTNGSALFAANSFHFDLKESLNLSRQKFLEWSGFLTGECELAVKSDKSNSSWVKFTTPRWNCIVKQIEGKFPNWRQVVPSDTDSWTKVQLSEASIKQMLNLSSQLPGDDTKYRALQLRIGSELQLEGKNEGDKTSTVAVINDVKVIGKPIVTALNREYLQTALRCGLDEIRICDELTPLLFLKGGKRLLVMPVRLSGSLPETKTTTLKPQPEVNSELATTSKPIEERKPEMPKPIIKPEIKSELSLIDRVEAVKDTLKNVIRDLAALADAVKLAEKNQRASEKEVEAARATLKKLQQVSL